MDIIDEEERQRALEHLLNPKMPDLMLRGDYGCYVRDLPPRRTLRERLRTLLRRAPRRPAA